MAKVIVMQAPSGAGKSTYIAQNYPEAFICSTDHFFIGPVTGEYKFHPSQLGRAHAECLRKFTELVRSPGFPVPTHIVVDNTNTSMQELAPYCALALAYGHELEIVRLVVPAGIAAARNTHAVPLEVVLAMSDRILVCAREIPPFWPVTEVTL